MSSYLIFALVLTVAYVIYYAVIIIQDLYGKKGGEKSDVEEFDVRSMEDTEDSVSVTESEEGFSIGNEDYHVEYEPAEPTTSASESTPDRETEIRKRIAEAEAKMEENESYMLNPCTTDEIYRAAMSGGMIDNTVRMEFVPVNNRI